MCLLSLAPTYDSYPCFSFVSQRHLSLLIVTKASPLICDQILGKRSKSHISKNQTNG